MRHGLERTSEDSSLFVVFGDTVSLSWRVSDLEALEYPEGDSVKVDSVVTTTRRFSQNSPQGLSKYVERTDVWTNGLSTLTMLRGVGR